MVNIADVGRTKRNANPGRQGALCDDEAMRRAMNEMEARTVYWIHHEGTQVPMEGGEVVGGSGTLVGGKGWQGVITAAHCLRPESRQLREGLLAVATAQTYNRRNAMCLARMVNGRQRGQIIAHWPGRNRGERIRRRGPDIAFVPLDTAARRQLEGETGAIFHNVEREWGRRIARGQSVLFLAVGHVAEQDAKVHKAMGVAAGIPAMVAKRLQVVRAPRTRKYVRDGWDYASLAPVVGREAGEDAKILEPEDETPKVVRDISLETPASWKGMSGGGVWWMGMNPQKNGKEQPFGLSGMVYYEDTTPSGKVRLYAHGRESLKRLTRETTTAGLDYTPEIIRCRPRGEEA